MTEKNAKKVFEKSERSSSNHVLSEKDVDDREMEAQSIVEYGKRSVNCCLPICNILDF